MNLESQFLSKKRFNKQEEDIELNSKSIIKKFSKKIRLIHKNFKLEKDQEKRIIHRIFKACQDKSEETLYNIFSNEITDFEHLDLEDIDIEEFKRPVMYKVKSHTVKRRIYDIDSNKKLLRKNIWNYIESLIFELSYIKNIKSVDNHIKHNTKKDFEKKLMDSQIKELYEKHYNIKVHYIIERIQS